MPLEPEQRAEHTKVATERAGHGETQDRPQRLDFLIAIGQGKSAAAGVDLGIAVDVDVTELKLNESIRLSDLSLPKGVELVELAQVEVNDSVVVSINPPRAEEVEEEEEVEIAAEGEEEPASEE